MVNLNIVWAEVYGLLIVLKQLKNEESRKVKREEVYALFLLLNHINQNEIATTKSNAKDFYFTWLSTVERLIKFNGYTNLTSVVESLRRVWSSEAEIVSTISVFNNNESARILFLGELEEIAEEICINEYRHILEEQRNPNFEGLKVGWV